MNCGVYDFYDDDDSDSLLYFIEHVDKALNNLSVASFWTH